MLYFFIAEIIVECVNLIQMSKLNRKVYRHDGEQGSFYLYGRNEEFQIYLIKTVLKTTSNAIFNMKKVDLDGS